MAVQFTGYTASSPLHYLLDAGAVYTNITYDETTGEFSGNLLGATSGGCSISISQELRQIEVDGIKGRTMGGTVVDEEVPSLTVNLKELTARNLALAIAGSDVDEADTNYDIITSRGRIELTDYLENVAYVGRISGSDEPIVVIIENAMALEGLSFDTEDRAEAVVSIVFTGHYNENNVELGRAPYRIYYPKMDEIV